MTPRTEMDIAVVGVGVNIALDAGGVCTAARVSLGAVAPTPLLVEEAGAALMGSRLDAAALDKLAHSFRAPCVPQVVFGVEGVVNELAQKIGMDPLDLRIKNAAMEGYKTIYGETFGPIGFVETLIAAKNCDHYKSPVPKGQGRGVAAGFWFNRGGETTGTLHIAADGSVTIILGMSDVAGSRTSIGMMAAEEFGIPVDKVRAVMADTHALGWNRITAGSRTTYSSGMVIIDSTRKAITELCRRAALIWGVRRKAWCLKTAVADRRVPMSANFPRFRLPRSPARPP